MPQRLLGLAPVLVLAAACGSSAACGRDEPGQAGVTGPTRTVAEPDEAAQPMPPRPPPDEPPPPDDTPGAIVSVGDCDVGWLPAGTVIDVPAEQTESLVENVRQWVQEGASREILVDTQRGVVFAKSEDDLGADPPYPTRTRAQSELVCGVATTWLVDHVRNTFARQATSDYGGVTCHENVCCFSGMEYMSSGILIARQTTLNDTPYWVLDAYVEVAEATLGEEYVERNRSHVARALTRHERRRTCPGEPPGHQ